MVSVLIADDHTVVRHGLREILTHELEGAFFGEAETAAQTLAMIQERPWDLLILDISMPGCGGLEVLHEIKNSRSTPRVLVLSMHPEDQYAVRSLRAGAAGYITKGSPREELIAAVRRVLAGGKYVSATLAESLASNLDEHSDKPLHEKLSNREFEVLSALASGKSISLMAAELHLSIKTISTYRRRVLEKMQMKTNADLVRYALEQGIAGRVTG